MAEDEPGATTPTPVTKPVRDGPMWGLNAGERVRVAVRRFSRPRSETADEPKPEPTSAAHDVQRIRTELADAGIAARRGLARLRLARVIIAAAGQVVIAFIAWRIWVWRSRRRRTRRRAVVPR